jgi:hypothetical protein
LSFQFRIQHPALTKLFNRRSGWGFPLDGWIDAKSVLALTPGQCAQTIILSRGGLPRRAALFKRAFDSSGHIDQKASENLWN